MMTLARRVLIVFLVTKFGANSDFPLQAWTTEKPNHHEYKMTR
jgi:hypothetical protein